MLDKLVLKEIDQIIIERHLVKKQKPRRILDTNEENCYYEKSLSIPYGNDIIEKPKLDPSFVETLFKIIDEKELKDSDVYLKAGLDRKVFSKIRNNTIKISKNNAIALCIALELDIDSIDDLLSKAGYALSKSSMRDVIIRQCITKNIFDISLIDEYLIYYQQKTIIKYN